jgi:Peptidase A4 family
MASGQEEEIDFQNGECQMHTNGVSNRLAILVAMGIVLLSICPLANAQSDALRQIYISAANVPTNIPGVHTYAEPPKGFNPVTATDTELATYGFPPRPDQQAQPDEYAGWEQAMKRSKIRWTGALKLLPGGGQGKVPVRSSLLVDAAPAATAGPKQENNVTASGVILTNNQKSWNSKLSFNQIYATVTVPTVEWAFNSTCNDESNGWEYSFAGIDGSISPGPADGYPLFEPGLVGGVVEYADCQVGGILYDSFVGYWPVLNAAPFSVNPGDVLYTAVSVQGPCNGTVFVSDETTSVSASYGIGVGACNFIGQNAEWTVTRSCCSGPGPGPDGEWYLPDTTHISFDAAYAEKGNGMLSYPGSQASTTMILTMMNDSDSQAIETVTQGSAGYQGLHSLFFTTTGCAVDGGCNP